MSIYENMLSSDIRAIHHIAPPQLDQGQILAIYKSPQATDISDQGGAVYEQCPLFDKEIPLHSKEHSPLTLSARADRPRDRRGTQTEKDHSKSAPSQWSSHHLVRSLGSYSPRIIVGTETLHDSPPHRVRGAHPGPKGSLLIYTSRYTYDREK